jgi:hypothetical protein
LTKLQILLLCLGVFRAVSLLQLLVLQMAHFVVSTRVSCGTQAGTASRGGVGRCHKQQQQQEVSAVVGTCSWQQHKHKPLKGAGVVDDKLDMQVKLKDPCS